MGHGYTTLQEWEWWRLTDPTNVLWALRLLSASLTYGGTVKMLPLEMGFR